MPTYEYRCQQCATEFQIRQSFADDPLTNCVDESCNGTVNKVFRGVGISFKGDGFYKNDHGASSKTRRPSSDTSDSSKSTSDSSKDSSDSSKDSSDSSKSTSGTSGSTTEKVATPASGSNSSPSD